MIVYKIKSKTANYFVYKDTTLILSATRHDRLFGETIVFYNPDGEKVINVKHYYFLVFGFGYKIHFIKEGYITNTKAKWGKTELMVDNSIYKMKSDLFSRNENLFLDGEIVGKYKIIKENLISFEHEISCNSERACYIFSIMDIIQHNYDIG